MLLQLPLVRPFSPGLIQPELVDSRTEGPGGFGLAPDSATTDGGGWWEYRLENMMAWKPDHFRALRAFALRARGGRRIIVPVIDKPQRITPLPDGVPFSDGTTFSDGTMFEGGAVSAYLEEAVAIRADEATIVIESGQSLRGGDYFSLDRGALLGPELHLTDEVESLGSNRWRVHIGPHFRQAHPAGAACDFDRPAFTATLQTTSGLWPKIAPDWIARSEAVFVEAAVR